MRFFKTVGIILICCVADGIARSFLPGLGGSMAWLYYTVMILGIGDIGYYVLFAVIFELIAFPLQRTNQAAWVYIITGALIASILFFIAGSQRFYRPEQITTMGGVYPLLGGLYGFLYTRWILMKNLEKESSES
ncbi:hypothetical protein GCM10027592_47890 [Spirosoma flavus]